MNFTKNKIRQNYGFTIVELLVVIVVIGVLAAISLVSYSGISQKAIASSIASDLDSASQKIKMYYVDNSAYPDDIDCGATPAPRTICFKPSGDNEIESYDVNNAASPPTFSLVIKNQTIKLNISENSSPSESTTPAVLSDDFETGTLASLGWDWTPSDHAPDIVDSDPWLITGSKSGIVGGSYDGSTVTWSCSENTCYDEGGYTTKDGRLYKNFNISGQTTLSLKVKSMRGGSYDQNRISIYDGSTLVKQWDTGHWYGGLVTNGDCDATNMTVNNLSFDISAYNGKTLTLLARAHNGGWCGVMSIDDILVQ